MSLEKRKAVLELAKKYDVMILEDNPYGDLRFAGEDVPSIKSLDTEGRVIYCGSFSKVLAPGLRVGYVVAHKEVIQKIVVCKQVSDVHTNILAQMIDLTIPRDQLVVFTGLSGSGKSSLAFDTIYADGQRRYVESLSSYARQFLGQMEKPDVDDIEGLSPAISIDQKTTSKNPRSTVGTVTEIYDYLRLLYARIGVPHCPVCGREIKQQTVDQVVDQVMAMPERTKIQILAPVVKGRKGEHVKELDAARRSGYVRVRVDGNLYDLSETIKLEKNKKHNIEVVVDRLVIKEEVRSRLADSLETAVALSDGLVIDRVEHHIQ